MDNDHAQTSSTSKDDILKLLTSDEPTWRQKLNKVIVKVVDDHAQTSSTTKDDILKLLTSDEPTCKQKLNKVILKAVDEDDVDTLLFLLENGHKIDKINHLGQTFLHCAFYKKSVPIFMFPDMWIPYITEDVVKIVDSRGLTILHAACCLSYEDGLVEKCLDCNADVNACFRDDPDGERDGYTPLHFATANDGELSAMKLLIDRKANVNAEDFGGRTPLHIACRVFEEGEKDEFCHLYVKAIKFLLDNGADINASKCDGNTPLHSLFPDTHNAYSIYERNAFPIEEIILKFKVLLERGADVTMCNLWGETILHLIVKSLKYLRGWNKRKNCNFNDSDHLEMVQLILGVCPDFNVNKKNIDDHSPLQLAISSLSVDIVRILLIHGADTSEVYLHLDNNEYFQNDHIVPQMEQVVNFLSIIELLTNKDFEIDAEENLEILEYLTHDYCDGECGHVAVKNERNASTNLLHYVNFGSSAHFQTVYNKLTAELVENSSEHCQTIIFNLVVDNLKVRKYAKFYIDSTLPEIFTSSKQLDIPLGQHVLENLEKELDRIKFTKMRESVTLYDVMTKHPHDIYQYITDVNLNALVQDYPLCEKIIKGHLTKSLVRRYVEKSTFDYLKELLPPSCPSLCSKKIMDYLCNEDILNVCRVVLDD